MPAKKTRRADVGIDLGAHAKAHQRAYEWAAKAIAHRQDGDRIAAANAERKAKHWLRKAMQIEARYPGMSREAMMRKQ